MPFDSSGCYLTNPREEEQTTVLMVIIMWFLWTNWNVVREEKQGRSVEELGRSIIVYANEDSQTLISTRPSKPQQIAS